MNVLKSLGVAIGGIAPTLATMLGGPLAGTAVTALESALGLKTGAGSDAVTQVVQAGLTPDQIAAIRVADQKHAEVIGQQQIDLAKLNAAHEEAFAKIDADDTANARARQVALRDWTPNIIGVLVVVVAMGLEGALALGFHKPTQVAGEVLGRILGTLDSATILVLSFWFGSSAGARRSTDALAEIAKQS
jgi:hypothetical protein